MTTRERFADLDSGRVVPRVMRREECGVFIIEIVELLARLDTRVTREDA